MSWLYQPFPNAYRHIDLYDLDPLSAFGSTVSTDDDDKPPGVGFDDDSLLELCDTVRTNLDEGRLGSRWEEAMGFLAAILRDEMDGKPVIELSTVENARLDKLLADIADSKARPYPAPSRFRDDVTLAERLQRRWRARFRQGYFVIDQGRYLNLPKTGRLRDIAINSQAEGRHDLWKAKSCQTVSELEGNLECEPGQ